MAWDPREYDIEKAIRDGAYQGKEILFNDDGFVQKIRINSDDTADVDWFAPSNSEKKHWHFVFKLDKDGRVVPKSGKLCHN